MVLLTTVSLGSAAAEVLPTGTATPSQDPEFHCGILDTIQGNPGPGQECKVFNVTNCPGPDVMAIVRVTENTGNDGSILFFGPGSGQQFWAQDGKGILESHLLQRDLSTGANDFKIVEVRWADFWHHGDDVNLIGPHRLACRVATLVEGLLADERYHHCDDFPDDCTDVCATGQSGGANQLAFTLTHYQMEARYKGVIFTSGPPYADLELGCSDECDVDGIPNGELGCYSALGRWLLDTAYATPVSPSLKDECVPPPPGGPPYENVEECAKGEFPNALCVNRAHQPEMPGFDQEFADSLPEASIAVQTGRWDYEHDGLGIAFIFGLQDNGAARFQGEEVYFPVLDARNDDVGFELVNAPHDLHEDPLGTAQILESLSQPNFCEAVIP